MQMRPNFVVTPVFYFRLILGIIALIFLTWAYSQFPFRITGIWSIFLLLIAIGMYAAVLLWVLRYSVHYKLSEKGITVYFWMIPVRTVRWSAIGKAEYVYQWRRPKTRYTDGTAYGNIIFVTLKGCPSYFPTVDMRWLYNVKHPFRSFTMWLPSYNISFYTDFFKKYYPELKHQKKMD